MRDIFAVAAREGGNLWLVLRIRRAQSGFYVLVPHPDRKWDAHLSYHTSGRLHLKTHGRQPLPHRKVQPVTGQFRGSVHMGKFVVSNVGVICEPAKFRCVIEVPIERLRSPDSFIAVDVVEPGAQPMPAAELLGDIVQEAIITETNPNIVIRLGMQRPLPDEVYGRMVAGG